MPLPRLSYIYWLIHFKYVIIISSSSNHGVVILNRSKIYIWKSIEIDKSLISSALRNLNETRNASSPGFFLKILNSVFKSINKGLDYNLFLQLFVIGFRLFFIRIGKR